MFANLKNEINIIVRLLLQRFKKLFNIVINVMIHEKYIIKDVVNKRKLRKYVQKIIRSTKNVELKFIYNDIDFNFRRNIKKFRNLDFNAFLNKLNESKYE